MHILSERMSMRLFYPVFFLSLFACNSWGEFWKVSAGPSGEYLLIVGNATKHTYRYLPESNSFAAGPDLTGNAGDRANSFYIESGIHAGKIMIVHANNTSGTSIYDPVARSLVPGADTGANITSASHTITIRSGPESGKVILMIGNTALTRIYDPANNSFAPGPGMAAAVGGGYATIAIPSGTEVGKHLVVSGNASNLYDPGTNNTTPGPAPGNFISNGGHVFAITAGVHNGRFAMVEAGGVSSGIQVYSPASHTFAATLALTSNAGDGSHSFYVSTGLYSGGTITVHGNTGANASFYHHSTNSMTAMNVGDNSGIAAHSIPIIAGPHNGKQLLFMAGGSPNTRFFDPASGNFSAGPAVPEPVNAGSHAIALP